MPDDSSDPTTLVLTYSSEQLHLILQHPRCTMVASIHLHMKFDHSGKCVLSDSYVISGMPKEKENTGNAWGGTVRAWKLNSLSLDLRDRTTSKSFYIEKGQQDSEAAPPPPKYFNKDILAPHCYMTGHTESIRAITSFEDCNGVPFLVTGSYDKTAILWNMAKTKPPRDKEMNGMSQPLDPNPNMFKAVSRFTAHNDVK